MLFQCAQIFTNYAFNYAQNLPTVLKLCPLFLEGPNLYVQIIILPNNVHRDCIIDLKPGLDAYWEIYTKTTWTMYCSFSYHVKTLSLGQGPQHGDEILHSLRLGLGHTDVLHFQFRRSTCEFTELSNGLVHIESLTL